jgi:nitroreductase
MSRDLEIVLAYHEATKHAPARMAPGPGRIDWENEPAPFRRYRGAPLVELPRPEPRPGEGPAYDIALAEGNVPPRPLDSSSVSQLFFDSLAVTAWRRAGGAAWALRANPSSGNLHPTEGYLISGPVPDLFDRPTVAHYAPEEHALEVRGQFSQEAWLDISSGLPAGTVLVGFTSIPWRESWKYGERAFRYLQINLGHALAAISFASAALGWRATLLDGLGTGEVGLLLGVAAPGGPGSPGGPQAGEGSQENINEKVKDVRADDEAEIEIPDCIVAVHPQGRSISGFALSDRVLDEFRGLWWHGVPDRLSSRRVDWPLLEGVAEATTKPPTPFEAKSAPSVRPEPFWRGTSPDHDLPSPSLRELIRQRRSAIVMDPAFSMSRDDFYSALERMISAPGTFPHHLHPWMPQVHLAIFVHRVLGLDRGFYLLVRDPDDEDLLRKSMRGEFEWSRPEGAPQGFRRLARGEFRDLAAALSCRQKIASDGCFSLAMIARFRSCLEEHGPWFYNRLFWEGGIVGQALYLEAERRGLRGCGIGCYFDDPLTTGLGLSGTDWQSLYAFAVGREAPLRTIETLPGYPPSISSREKVKSP